MITALVFLGCALIVVFGLYVILVGVSLLFGEAMFGGKPHALSFIPVCAGLSLVWFGVHAMPFSVSLTAVSQ